MCGLPFGTAAFQIISNHQQFEVSLFHQKNLGESQEPAALKRYLPPPLQASGARISLAQLCFDAGRTAKSPLIPVECCLTLHTQKDTDAGKSNSSVTLLCVMSCAQVFRSHPAVVRPQKPRCIMDVSEGNHAVGTHKSV